MTLLLPLHIVGGVVAIVSGYVALAAGKGARLHRRSGLVFVAAMMTMSLSGALIAALHSSAISVVAGLLTFYFVITALATVRPLPQPVQWIHRAATLLAVTVGVMAFVVGASAAASGRPEAAPLFIFGLVGLLAAAGDFRVVRAGGIHGPRRIARHLWRMCFAMWVAAASFFWGPQQRVPEMIRIPLLQAIAVLIPLGVMVYWLWRYRRRRRAVRAITSDGAVGTA
jgi:uncharacterized membrane protein